MKDGNEVNFWLKERLNDNDLVLLQQNLAEFTKDNSEMTPSADLHSSTRKPLETTPQQQHDQAFIINGATNRFNTLDAAESQPVLKNASTF